MRSLKLVVALVLASLSAAPAMAQHLPEDLIAAIPRGGSVDVPLGLDPSWRTLRPLSMSATAGPRLFRVERAGRFGGRKLRYTATLAETILHQDGKPVARLFNTAYVAKTVGDPAKRPVVFLFNGGPGAPAAPLHFQGAWGPRKHRSGLVADRSNRDNRLVDNPDCPLDAMDLVFLDPVDTGFSRSEPGQADLFRSVDTDAEAAAQFVAWWLKTNNRSTSPVYIGGESYGSMRVVALARDLTRTEPKIVVAGVMIMGPAPTFGQNGRTPNPLFVAAELPMMASVAYHYGKIDNKGQTWEQAVEKARQFGRKQWLPALVAGHDLSLAEFDHIVSTLPSLIGIPERYFRENRTISVADFNRELLRGEGLVLDRNNGLETHPTTVEGASGAVSYDAFAANIADYYAHELKVSGLGEYWLSTPPREGARPWNFNTTGAPALDVTLAKLMGDNPGIRVHVMQGRYDTLTDLGTTEYVLAQTDLPRSRLSFSFYDGGHLVANTPESNANLRKFIAGAPIP